MTDTTSFSVLDIANERKAIDDGMCSSPVFPENKLYMLERVKKEIERQINVLKGNDKERNK